MHELNGTRIRETPANPAITLSYPHLQPTYSTALP